MYINYLVLYFIKTAVLHYSYKIHFNLMIEANKMSMFREIGFIRFIINHSSNKFKNMTIFCSNYMIAGLKLSSLNLDSIKYCLRHRHLVLPQLLEFLNLRNYSIAQNILNYPIFND